MRKILTCIAVLLFTTQTMPLFADIVSFVNPPFGEEGHFDWTWQRRFEDESPLNWLDITKAPTDQEWMGNTNSIGQLFSGGGDNYDNVTSGGAFVARMEDSLFTKALTFGDPVHEEDIFVDVALHAADVEGWIISDFEVGVPVYIGVLTGDGNFGWIEVVRGVEGELREFVAIAWAYETIPGKPIYAGQVPAPSVLALLGTGLFISKRRQRKN